VTDRNVYIGNLPSNAARDLLFSTNHGPTGELKPFPLTNPVRRGESSLPGHRSPRAAFLYAVMKWKPITAKTRGALKRPSPSSREPGTCGFFWNQQPLSAAPLPATFSLTIPADTCFSLANYRWAAGGLSVNADGGLWRPPAAASIKQCGVRPRTRPAPARPPPKIPFARLIDPGPKPPRPLAVDPGKATPILPLRPLRSGTRGCSRPASALSGPSPIPDRVAPSELPCEREMGLRVHAGSSDFPITA